MRSGIVCCVAILSVLPAGCGRRAARTSPADPPAKLNAEVTFKDSK